jgi:type I restriction enzyme M protein
MVTEQPSDRGDWMSTRRHDNSLANGGGDFPFAKTLFEAADKLRGSVESAEYKHLVLGLIFVKYISDAFERRRKILDHDTRDPQSDVYTEDETERIEILEDRDEYLSQNVFWVPENARWEKLLAAATQTTIGTLIDQALEEIERDNPPLRGVLPRIYARAAIQPEKLGALVSKVGEIGFGETDDRARDVLGRVYEYFIKAFARAEGHRGGEFYTPVSVTRLLVEMLEPFEGRVLDPACGSGGLFIQSARFVEAHGGRPHKISILGQENNQATWRIAKMNLAIHGLSGDVRLGDSLLSDAFAGTRADFVLANPPFNMRSWGASQVANDARWAYGSPPDANANFAWIQHFLHHLAPDGRAGFVMANGSLSSNQNGEGAIREGLLTDDVVDCIVALPVQLFFTTGIPVCLWFLDRNKASDGERDRRGETLFIDARTFGSKVTRTQIELSEEEIAQIATTYHSWRNEPGQEPYEDVAGFCRAVRLAEIEAHGFVLTPGRYVGAEEHEHDHEAFDGQMKSLVRILDVQLREAAELDDAIREALESVGYGL